VVRGYSGHGIGHRFMKSASAELRSHRLEGDSDARMTPAMAAIEPLVNAGSPETRVLADGWTVVTVDHGLSVHFRSALFIYEPLRGSRRCVASPRGAVRKQSGPRRR
jgi:methionyl aminopeptidase